MVTALYRRYRPETFAELIGQSQVTDPLMTALRTNRVNHAYLFSGPRGCGKTTSARILARCLNCVEGPTDTPCGKCASCVELSRAGGGSLDVVEIDAASHNGVDDARDLRERAVFAPARDRYKIFILDEAHMVTPQGFNALLKIVEEPPEHVKFIFATTEPEKVIGTIRSRTHHYPFRLVPPAQMLEYVGKIAQSEKVDVEPGVLPLVVRAGGGSVRDTLSLLDQLIAGSDSSSVEYERAVALLGYTHGALLDAVIDAIGARDAAAAFSAVDRVIQTGQDPRRFVEDLLERLRDLIVVSAFSGGNSDGVAAVLRGIQQDELDRMSRQAALFGVVELSRAADVANAALTEMTGATSPRLHLELMVARVLVPASDESERGTLARVERLERRIGVESSATAAEVPPVDAHQTRASAAAPGSRPIAGRVDGEAEPDAGRAGREAVVSRPGAETSQSTGLDTPQTARVASRPASGTIASDRATQPAVAPVTTHPSAPAPVTFQQVKDAWPEILNAVQKAKRSAWMVVYTATPLALRDDLLVLSFPSQADVDGLKQHTAPGEGVGDYLKNAIVEVLGFQPSLSAKVDVAAGPREQAPPITEPEVEPETPAESIASAASWETVPIAHSAPDAGPASTPANTRADPAAAKEPAPTTAQPATAQPATGQPTTGQPATAQPTTGQPTTGQPTIATAAMQPTTATAAVQPTTATAAKEPATTTAAMEPATTTAQPATAQPATAPGSDLPAASQRYGESVVREILGASFIEEQTAVPRVTPRGD